MVVELLAALAVSVLALGFTYYVVLVWWGLRAARRHVPGAGTSADARYDLFFLVPCLDEEGVIVETVTNLLDSDARGRVVVIDDASSDGTAAAVEALDDDRVVLCRRALPEARHGKGPALNAGFEEVLRIVECEALDPESVIVCVMDADGRLSPGAVEEVMACFGEARVGGVQLPVQIRNRGSLLTNMQDFEFWGVSAVAQLARTRTRSVSLGGNGQFTRLRALLSVGPAPWGRALTEDLELAVNLQLQGWELVSTPGAHVSQQGVVAWAALLRQRTRWFQGHMECSKRVGDLWRCLELRNATVLETVMYLVSPLVLALPWSIVFNLALIDTWVVHVTEQPPPIFGSELLARVVRTGAWYVLSFLPALIGGYIYARRRRGTTVARAVLYGHVMVVYTYLTWFCCWRALVRIGLGRNAWDKTSHAADEPHVSGTAGVGLEPVVTQHLQPEVR